MLVFAVFGASLGLTAGVQPATELSGTISTTLTITRDARLVGDVTCTVIGAPCIQIAASGVTLRLEGFSITGRADPATGCAGGQTAGEHGIADCWPARSRRPRPGNSSAIPRPGHPDRRGSTRVLVRQVTASTNCLSGIIVTGGTSDNDVEANIAVRNGNMAPLRRHMTVRRHQWQPVPCEPAGWKWLRRPGNGLVSGSLMPAKRQRDRRQRRHGEYKRNIILSPGAQGNLILRNLVVGNPPYRFLSILQQPRAGWTSATFLRRTSTRLKTTSA